MGGTGDNGSAGGGPVTGPECPRKFETRLVDVFQTGNTEYVLALQPGSQLGLQASADASGVEVTHQAKLIGYLPPQHNVVAECIQAGWKYTASVIEIAGDATSPIIKILVVGTPS